MFFLIGFLALMVRAPIHAQFVVVEHCAEEIVASADGKFSLLCEVRNLAAEGDFSVLTFGENVSVDVTPRQKILNRNEVVPLNIRGTLVDPGRDGLVEIEVRWSDYEGKPMLTKHELRVLHMHRLKK